MLRSCLALLALAVLAGEWRSVVAAAGERSLLQAAAPAAERAATAFEVSYGGYSNYFRSDSVASGEGGGWAGPCRHCPRARPLLQLPACHLGWCGGRPTPALHSSLLQRECVWND